MTGPTATGTKTSTSIDVHAKGEPGRILPGAYLRCRGGSAHPMVAHLSCGGVRAVGTLALAGVPPL
jgi:hypothetical protein